MRKYLAAALGAFLALACVNVAGAGADIQSIDAKLTPKKMSKKKFKPATIAITIETQNNDQAGDLPPNFQNQPPAATRTIVDFPKNMKFNTNAAPHCKVSDAALANTTTEQAIEILLKAAQADPSVQLLPWLEREFTRHAMQVTRGNQLRAAKLLGMTRATLRKRLERFGITKELTIS